MIPAPAVEASGPVKSGAGACSSRLGRIVRPADYERVLGTSIRLRSPHFAVHHLDGRLLPARIVKPSTAVAPAATSLSTDLSTGAPAPEAVHVDEPVGPQGCWLGLVVPKRHAKRAVTRTLFKRQIRQIAADCAAALPQGLWVVRLRAPFDVQQFPSATSDALRLAARAELLQLFARAARDERDPPRPPRPPGAPRGFGRGKSGGKAAKPAPSVAGGGSA